MQTQSEPGVNVIPFLRVIAFLALSITGVSSAQATTSGVSGCATGDEPIETEGYVPIGGIEQWITVSGARCGNPIVLFVHGGPGNPMSPYAAAVYGAWRDEFTLVQWDQRGAGRTFARHPLTEDMPLTLDRMSQDGIAVAEHLVRQYGQRKVIVLGSSWGSALGVHMVKARPDLFHAYVGTGQLVERMANLKASVDGVRARAVEAGDAEVVAALEALGAPPWSNPRHFGALRRLTRKYEATSSKPAPKGWWVAAPAYATADALAAYEAGEEYSYLQFVGMSGDGMLAHVDLPALGSDFEVPMYLLQGQHDLVTTADVARGWLETIDAPAKAFVVIPETGHDPNEAMVAAQREVLRTRVLPAVGAAGRKR